MIPLHAELVPLLDDWTTRNRAHIRAQQRLMADEHKPLDRRTVHRIVATTAKKAGIGHAYPHQLRHTLATQASIEACAWRPSPRCSATGRWT